LEYQFMLYVHRCALVLMGYLKYSVNWVVAAFY
jgi:hypothetical protein